MGSLPAHSGTLVVNSVANPAVGMAFLIQTAVGVLMRIIAVNFTLTCDANAANRLVYFEIRDATRSVTRVQTTRATVANAVHYFSLWSGYNGVPAVAADQHLYPLPNNYIQSLTYYILVFAEGIQLGDQFSDIAYAAEEWIIDA